MIIHGGPGNGALSGTSDSDTFYTDGGAHTMYGRRGDDVYYVDNSGALVREAVSSGDDVVYASVSYTLASAQEVEYLRVWGSAGLTLTGNQLANSLTGGSSSDTLNGGPGNDRIDGAVGADVMSGGSGDDTFFVDNPGDQVFEAVGGGNDVVYAAADWTMTSGQEIDTLRVSGSAGLTLGGNDMGNVLYGGVAADTLNGGGGLDSLDGGAGADVMSGGSGYDTYYVDNVGDRVIEAIGGGSDRVRTSVSYALEAGQEIETLEVSQASAGLTLTGNEFANTLIGSYLGDTLNGGGGNDTLYGGGGADLMSGGSGDDTFYGGSQVIEAVGGGNDTIYARGTYTLGVGQEVETLRALGTGKITFTGNEFANALFGSSANDTLNGGSGNDRLHGDVGGDLMTGGSGNDVYFVDNAGDHVIEAVGGGSDTVYATVSYTLVAGHEVEALRVGDVSAGLTLIGNEFANHVVGGTGNDILKGGDGNDGLSGGAGDDTLFGGQGADQLNGGTGVDWVSYDQAGIAVTANLAAGQGSGGSAQGDTYTDIENLRGGYADDTLVGNTLANRLAGGSGDDTLDGGAGADTLAGGTGHDVLTGGAGVDIFEFESPLGVANSDIITDFDGATETIRLATTFFPGFTGQLAAAQFSTSGPTGTAPQIVYDQASGILSYASGGTQTLFAVLENHAALTASNFVAS